MNTFFVLLTLLFSFSVSAKIEIKGNEIHIVDDPNFEAKLEVKQFTKAGQEAVLKETGYIVANAQTSFENERFVAKWVSLDDVILKNNGVQLSEVKPSKGLAYGIISTSEDFKEQIKLGQVVRIKRYGLQNDNFTGKVISIKTRAGQGIIQIHFLATNAEELIAGTTCEVEISHIKVVPYIVSLLSLLHLGDEDYVLIKQKAGTYSPKHATILDQDSETATILIPISSETQYIARGAILLKPLIDQIVAPRKDEL